ncbi:MAG: T9SS type A sorting domain-containing protein [Bacteroidetes bacterium]|nr:T9SS type A sorting domain-containing protein [Bacteroidota bacterium]
MKTKIHFILSLLVVSTIPSFAQTLSLVKDINPSGNSNPYYLQNFQNKMYFVANPGTGYKLYSSDGTTVGTQMVGPTNGSGNLYPMISYNNFFYFNYDDGISGAELWKSDGTTAGTVLVKDIVPGSGNSSPRYITGANGKVFFVTNSPNNGIWVSDGTSSGTQQLISSVIVDGFNNRDYLPSYNGSVYFSGNNGALGLWKSDGTASGTQLLKNLWVNSYLDGYAIYNGEMYFPGNDTTGTELWKTNGTTAGTVLVKNINPTSGSDPEKFLISNNKIFFVANDGTNGKELWISDGTTAGTVMVKDITPGSSNSEIQSLVEYNGLVYFFIYNNGNRQMYQSDGTAAGTVFIKSIPFNTVPYTFVFGNKLFFLAKSLGSSYLFMSDGTANGTLQIAPNISSEDYSNLQFTNFNSNLYLPCYNGNTGVELNKLTFSNLSISESDLKDFKIYPNPSSDGVFHLDKLGKITQLEVYDLLGRKVPFKINNSQLTISDKGLFLLNIQTNTTKETIKILVK